MEDAKNEIVILSDRFEIFFKTNKSDTVNLVMEIVKFKYMANVCLDSIKELHKEFNFKEEELEEYFKLAKHFSDATGHITQYKKD